MKIKGLLLLMLALMVAVCCMACGNGDSGATTTQAPTTTAATTTKAPTTTQTPSTSAPENTTSASETSVTEQTNPPAGDGEVSDWSVYSAPLSLKAPEDKVPAASYTVWSGVAATGFAGGDGSEANPYLIANGEQLFYLSEVVAGGEEHFDGVHFKLTSDIYLNDLSDYKSWSAENAPANMWVPIGDATDLYFGGSFDGAGYTVYGMYVNEGYSGLFGRVHGGATQPSFNELSRESCGAYIKNVTVAYSYLDGAGHNYTAGIAAVAKFGVLIENCVVDSTVTLTNTSSSSGLGGISGRASGVYIYNCISKATLMHMPSIKTDESTGEVTVGYSGYTGGIVGAFWGYVDTCANFGNVYGSNCMGSIVGIEGCDQMPGTIVNCFAAGTLNNVADLVEEQYRTKSPNCVGGIAGITANVDLYPEKVVQDCVVAVTFNVNDEITSFLGTISGKHKNPCEIENVLIIKEFNTPASINYNYDNGSSILFSNIAFATQAEVDAHK